MLSLRTVAPLLLAALLAVPSEIRFQEVPPGSSGIRWVHHNAKSPERHLPETVGPGCAFLDFDRDGWVDIYLVNSGVSDFYTPAAGIRNALLRNNRDGTFTDVTDRAGVAGGRFAMGVAVGDYNKDTWPDLYVTAYGRSLLFRNNGDGTFTDVAKQAAVEAPGWTTSAVWFDMDNDGSLDLFVSNFVEYSKSVSNLCYDEQRKRRFYCVPRLFKPSSSYLFRNNGDGTFTDSSASSGIAAAMGKAFGAVATDVNNDGRADLFVANDTRPNFLFLNKGGGKFDEIGLQAGVAYGDSGNVRSGMGVDAADYDGDGWQDLFVANIDNERFSLYRNAGDLSFTDEAGEIGQATRLLSGWGLRFFDADNDGDPDLILANGHPDDMIEDRIPGVRYREPLLFFENDAGKFRNRSGTAGPVFQKDFAARGLATGDYDNDGDLDVLIANNGEAPLLLRNEGGNRNNWLGLELRPKKSNPSAAGAVIKWKAGGIERSRLRTAGGSYLSSHDPREILGLGAAKSVEWVEIRWSSGQTDRFTNLPVRTYSKVEEGSTAPSRY